MWENILIGICVVMWVILLLILMMPTESYEEETYCDGCKKFSRGACPYCGRD
jgi:hypothetical protein